MSVRAVDETRWKLAQQWELNLWKCAQKRSGWRRAAGILRPLFRAVGSDKGAGDDWNRWWARQFGDYEFLPRHLGRYIELGCGPYTNTRLILRGRTAETIVCSDPLIDEYVRFKGRWLAEAHEKRLVVTDSHSMEDCPFASASFDTVVVINVLDHVRDAEVALARATALVKEGGYFVLGQDLASPADTERVGFDIGHPIQLDEHDVQPHLETFETVFSKRLARADGRAPEKHYATLLFAGRRTR